MRKVERSWKRLTLPERIVSILSKAPKVSIATEINELVEIACGSSAPDAQFFVEYDVPGKGIYREAIVNRVRNGVCANYTEPYMRRRDPNCTFIGDDEPTDKPHFNAVFGYPFENLANETYEWLKKQELIMFGFKAGGDYLGKHAIAIAPANTGFFALGLALLQGILSWEELTTKFNPNLVLYVAPVFRHTHFNGKQVVVHRRGVDLYEIFSYNLYPGPSAKKGVYGYLLYLGVKEGWITAHSSTVQVVTPYDNVVTIMHEGASGGGKSEMLENIHREPDGRILLGTNLVTKDQIYLELPRGCVLRPVTDDMALCHPSIQRGDGRLILADAEKGWFVRVNHIKKYGTDITLEGLTAQPPVPLLFLNIHAVPNSRAMIWEHTEDEPGVPCPNPRVILPRHIVPNVVTKPVSVDIRSFGVRTPPCTRDNPSYGIIGMFHLLPSALGWLWRLVAPRGHDNPSIIKTEGLQSEGVGSFWPFAPCKYVQYANLLLEQILTTPKVYHILCPNQHVGSWRVGFMPQWIAREYLARRGIAKFKLSQLDPSRCPLLGHTIKKVRVEGEILPQFLFQTYLQPEVGEEAYDYGSEILVDFFKSELKKYLTPELHPLGKTIIECVMDGGSLSDYMSFLPTSYIDTSQD
ncbi:MAG: DUF4914 family protein [Candidatus Hydrogenedentes bacterium]|nr:DUF4914 family protein [Candidatus Hydrogenedentota bacterium]